MYKVFLDEELIPKEWYNIQPDLPEPLPPPINPATREPVKPEELEVIFAKELVRQEASQERWIPIPEEVRDVYRIWRPTPLYRAYRLEKALKTPARIYFKYEGVSPTGSHKVNTAVAQAYYNAREGIRRLTTETGAGQWGSALAIAGALFGIDVEVFMVKVSYQQKPYRRALMETYGGKVHASPTNLTDAGRHVLERDPDSTGSLGIAISEAVEIAAKNEDTHYSLGSVLNHVCLHQTIIGLETKKQLKKANEKKPDIVIGCVGGGSNFAGLAFPFMLDKINGDDIEIIPVEPASCPTLTRAPYHYDFGDNAGLTPLLAMHTLGHGFIPPPIHAGGLRYHGVAPLISHAVNLGLATPRSLHQLECYEAAMLFARTEGIIPAPETSHAIAQTIREARKAKEEGKEKVIVFNFSGHGLMDLVGYDNYIHGRLTDYALSEEELEKFTADIQQFPEPKIG